MIHNVDPQLSQWDVGRVVSISDSNATHIHFANQGDSKAVIIEIENGSAKIPDYLLQTGKTVIAYAVKDGVTLESKSFSVRKREKPESYVYEEDDRNYIYKLITDAETAVVNAKQATTNANTATESATIATTNANVATNSANLATTKANTAAENANKAVTKANNAVKNMMVVGEAQGETIALNDAIDQSLVGLRVFGKTTQDGTPTPDAPVDLVSVGDDGTISTKVFGKNIIAPAMASGMLNGITITNNKDGSFTINGTATNNVSFRIDQSTANGTDKLKSYKGKFYISLRDSSGTINPQGLTLYLMQNETYKAILSSSTKPTADIETSKAFIYIEVPQGKTFSNLVVYPQLECGSTMTSWEMAREQSLDVTLDHNLNGIPVTSGGNYTDADGQQWICDEIDFARGLYIKRIGEKVFTGAEIYLDYTSSTGGVSTYLTHLDNTPFICSHFIAGNTARWANAGAILFNVAATGSATMDEFVAFVAEQYTNGAPITVVYILADPIKTPLSEEELAVYAALYTYKDHTTVSNDAGAYMELEYVMDAKKYIDGLIAGTIIPATVE